MVRLLGMGPKKPKKRYAAAALTPDHIRREHPGYQYALEEFAEAVAPGTSNDDGQLRRLIIPGAAEQQEGSRFGNVPAAPSGLRGARSPFSLQVQPSASAASSAEEEGAELRRSSSSNPNSTVSSSNRVAPEGLSAAHRSPFENEMPDATYEENYGPAWTGGTIKYVYPTGYQSMRPRSCPWKLSIVVTVVFTWLSVFIVGHCSDQTAQKHESSSSNNYNDNYNNANDYLDDDFYYIETSWCGSRPLYLMWVASMLITGLSCAYCSVIGYIKVRDFAVANSRSQPPGVVGEGKSDYYVRLQDHNNNNNRGSGGGGGGSNIYQSDGTPQFWGSQIYRPTQAAVAVTSR